MGLYRWIGPCLCAVGFCFARVLFCMIFRLAAFLVVHVCIGISEERATSSCTGGSDRAYVCHAAGIDSICIWFRSVLLWSSEPNAVWPGHILTMFVHSAK